VGELTLFREASALPGKFLKVGGILARYSWLRIEESHLEMKVLL
jgi:hypothetical protein